MSWILFLLTEQKILHYVSKLLLDINLFIELLYKTSITLAIEQLYTDYWQGFD